MLNLVVILLTKDLILHFLMLMLIFNLFTILSLKLIADNNLYSSSWENKILRLPLGNFINKSIKKILATWKISSILWVYFILFILFINTLVSGFCLFGVILSLSH